MLETVLLELGGKALSKAIGKKFGPELGDLAGSALKALAGAFGVEPEPIAIANRIEEVKAADPSKAQSAVLYAEATFADELAAQAEVMRQANAQQQMTNELLREQMKSGAGWRSDWLYAWQWFLLFAWAWSLVLAPLASAIAGAAGAKLALPVPDLGVLVTLTGLYLGLHMGGHTVLELMRGGTFGRSKGPDA